MGSGGSWACVVGIYAGRGQPRPFRHNSPESLETQIKKFGPGIICVDSIYSSKGTIAPLVEMSEIANNYGCVFVVDESHSLGITGPEGRGMIYELGLQSMVHFVTASLAKAFVSRAGVILGNVRDLEFLRYTSSPATGKRDTLVRLSLHSELNTDDVDHIIDACLNVRNIQRTLWDGEKYVGTTRNNFETKKVLAV